MPRNDEGEFELVLGNRQLLSVFFILVVMLGVFFTMGYIVGRSNPSPEAMELASAHGRPNPPAAAGGGTPIVVDPGKQGSDGSPEPGASKPSPTGPPPAPVKPATAEPKPQPKTEAPPSKGAEGKQTEQKTAEVKPPPKTETPKPAPAKTEPLAPKPVERATAPPPSGGVPSPPSGTFLQVAAIDRAGAQILAESLKKRSFAAVVAPGPTPEIYRVLVGPLHDPASVAKARTDLEGVGLKGPIVRKY